MVLDIMMPGADGLELCREIRKKNDIPIVFVSAKGEELDRVVGLELGADDYLVKPFSRFHGDGGSRSGRRPDPDYYPG